MHADLDSDHLTQARRSMMLRGLGHVEEQAGNIWRLRCFETPDVVCRALCVDEAERILFRMWQVRYGDASADL